MNMKENYLAALRCQEHEWVPFRWHEVLPVGMIANTVIEIPSVSGKDAFGVSYIATRDGSTVDNRVPPLLDDISEWKNVVHIPDLDSFPWEEWAEQERQMEPENASEMARFAVNLNGLFDRLVCLMGYEGACCALVEDPESCEEFFSAIADFKVDYMMHLHKYSHPDVIHYQDDVAHARGLFISPAAYRKMIKPHHKRIIDAIHSVPGVIALQHTCGKCEDIIPDYVEIGIDSWFPAQEVNDLRAIKQKYAGRLSFEYGLDSQGVLSNPNCPEEDLRANVADAIKYYGFDHGLTIAPAAVDIDKVAAKEGRDRRVNIIKDELNRHRRA
ncbi:MAG: uroporphyrinogen-III decarboxylase [Firmicutes bacterium]|nr:uroporphyrinogen-III decarboxylase [Bacillota bacterium]